jgi:transcriptional regulator with XRE-family HTH domain
MTKKKKPNSFGTRFRDARNNAGLTQEDVIATLAARGFPMPQSRLSHYETGRNNPDPDLMAVMADVVGKSLDYLNGLTDTQEPVAEIEEARQAAQGAGKINRIMDKLPKDRQQQILDYAEFLLSQEKKKAKPVGEFEEWVSATEVLMRRTGANGEKSFLEFLVSERPDLAASLGVATKKKSV